MWGLAQETVMGHSAGALSNRKVMLQILDANKCYKSNLLIFRGNIDRVVCRSPSIYQLLTGLQLQSLGAGGRVVTFD